MFILCYLFVFLGFLFWWFYKVNEFNISFVIGNFFKVKDYIIYDEIINLFVFFLIINLIIMCGRIFKGVELNLEWDIIFEV